MQISQKRDLPIDAAPEKPCMWHLFQQASEIYTCKESTSDIPGSDKSMRKTHTVKTACQTTSSDLCL